MNGEKVLWLPPEARPSYLVIKDSTLSYPSTRVRADFLHRIPGIAGVTWFLFSSHPLFSNLFSKGGPGRTREFMPNLFS